MNVPENPNEQADEEQTATPQPSCDVCGHALSPGARFCGHCGARVQHPASAGGAEDWTAALVCMTLGWLFLTLLFAAQPLDGFADDPLASVWASAMHLGFLFGLVTPLIVLLLLLLYRSWKRGSRVRLSLRTSRRSTPGSVVVLVALTWLLVSLLLRSEPGSDFTAAILWLIFTACLGVVWLGVLVLDAYRTWKASGLKKTPMIASYVIPLPLAAIALFVVIPGQAPLKMRFELSEPALSHYIERFEMTGGDSGSRAQFVGLFKVVWAYRREGCVILRTHSGLDYEGGLAHCRGRLPARPNIDLDHLEGQWWKYANVH